MAAVLVLQALEPAAGGLPEHVAKATTGLLARGHEVVVAGPPDGRGREDVQDAGGTWVPMPWDGSIPAPGADRRVLAQLGELLGSRRFDVVHAHGQKAGMLARTAASRRGVPSVWSPHTLVHRTQGTRPRRSAQVRARVGLAVERRLGARTTLIGACCHSEARAVVEDGLVPADRARVIDYGVDPDLTMAAHPGLAALPRPLLGFVATLREQKGLPFLLDALELLARRGEPVPFAIVGNGPLRDEVAARVEAEPLRATTTLLPFEGRVEPYLAAFDAFVLPSLFEGLPIAVLEAMAFGLPVVATAVDGTPEAVLDGVTGLLVAPADPPALAGALARIAADARLRAGLGAAGREHRLERWTTAKMLDGTEAVLEEAVRRGPRRS